MNNKQIKYNKDDYDKLNALSDILYEEKLFLTRRWWNNETKNLKVNQKAKNYIAKIDKLLLKLDMALEDGY